MTENEAIEWLRAISATQSNSLNKNSLTDRKEALHMAVAALEEVQQYRAIGTAGECQEAVKKQKPDKPLNKAKVKTFNGKAFAVTGTCPVCNSRLVLSTLKYCYICGQAIDRSVADETST